MLHIVCVREGCQPLPETEVCRPTKAEEHPEVGGCPPPPSGSLLGFDMSTVDSEADAVAETL